MTREEKFKVISEGIKYGVSKTCSKYNISRTIYYRWLKRYKELGIEGLDDIQKNFTPVNKTDEKVEAALFNLIKTYPTYGPRALKYLLEEIGHVISESAVFNIMKRHNLTNKERRLKFSKKNPPQITRVIPPLSELDSGECWIFWVTEVGTYKVTGKVYAFTFLDLKSQIACTRLYNHVSFGNFEDILTAVALSVATSLSLKIKYLCFFKDDKIISHSKTFMPRINKIIRENNLNVLVNVLNKNDDLNSINLLRKQYNEKCLSFLMDNIKQSNSFTEFKHNFQDFVRKYNLVDQITFDQQCYSPVDYHNKLTNTKLILPIWAYFDREY